MEVLTIGFWLHEPQIEGAHHCLGAVRDLQLANYVVYVVLDGCRAYYQLFGDILVSLTPRQMPQDLPLPRCQCYNGRREAAFLLSGRRRLHRARALVVEALD